jgi:hypothetical protein
MEIPLAFREKKFKVTTSVRQIMRTLFRGEKSALVDILIVVTL